MELDYEILNYVTAEEYIAFYKEAYKRKFGNPIPVLEKAAKSDICNELLRNSIAMKILPSANELVTVVMSSRYFIFSKPETICLASLTVLSKLMDLIIRSPLYPSSEWPISRKEDFTRLCLETINTCDKYKVHLNKENFFDHFLKSVQLTYLENQRRLWENMADDYDGDEGWIQ